MSLLNKSELIKTLRDNQLWARKSFGQNFLVSQKTLNKIIETAKIRPDDTVVEIGPGLGVLTEELGKRAKLVLAIEKDYKFCDYLRRKFKTQSKKIKIIHADILTYDLGLITCNYKVVANLPYNITSPVIRKFLEAGDINDSDIASFSATHSSPAQNNAAGTSFSDNPRHSPSLMVLMVQKEVAERICAKPGSSNRGVLTVMVEFYSQPEIVEIVDRSCFWPISKVDSAIIKIRVNPRLPRVQSRGQVDVDPRVFFRVVKAGFSQKRRQIHNPLSATLHLEKSQIYDILKKADINPKLRAEDLSLEEWIKLYNQLKV